MSSQSELNFFVYNQEDATKEPHKSEGIFIKTFFKVWVVPFLLAAGIGIYLSWLIVPLIINALVVLGLMPWLSLILGVAVGFSLVLGMVALPLSRVLEAFVIGRLYFFKRPEYKFPPVVLFWYLLALLAGTGLGIYLAVIVAPLVIHALTALGFGYFWALLAGITASFVLITSTIDLLAMPVKLYKDVVSFFALARFFKGLKGKGLPYIIAAIVGAGLGIYLATVVAPLFISALLALSISSTLAGFIAVASSVALITGCSRVFSAFGMFFDGLISRMLLLGDKSRQKVEVDAEPNVLRAVVLGGPLTELTLLVRAINNENEGSRLGYIGGRLGSKM